MTTPTWRGSVNADGVHVGQDDASVDEARAVLGGDAIIGQSTHSEEQIAAAGERDIDYFAVGPVWETPTKPGRPAVGLELVTHAAEVAKKPFFAIGGIGPLNAGEVVAAGAAADVRGAGDPRRSPPRKWRRKRCGAPSTSRGPGGASRPVAEARRKRKERGGRGAAAARPAARRRRTARHANGPPRHPVPAPPRASGWKRATPRPRSETRRRARRWCRWPPASARPSSPSAPSSAALVAASILITCAAGVKVNGSHPSLTAALGPVLIMGSSPGGCGGRATGRWSASRPSSSSSSSPRVYALLVEANSLSGFAVTVALLAVSGTLFWLMVKAMARIQMPDRAPPR